MEAGGLFRFLRKAGAGRNAAVTILLQDGAVLEFPNRIKCSELLVTYPGYTIFPAVALLRRQQGRMLAPDAFLEGGTTYFLLEKPSPVRSLHKSQQFIISKEHMARILREAGVGSLSPVLKRSTVPTRKPLQNSAPGPRRRAGSRQSWVSSLSTIPEVDAL